MPTRSYRALKAAAKRRRSRRTAWGSTLPAPESVAARKTFVKARNEKRHTREWVRAYHSPERVAFVKNLPCVACLGFGGIENAHIEGDGTSRKAHYTKIIPLTGSCHRAWHDTGDEFLAKWNLTREDLAVEADAVERRWQRHVARHVGRSAE